VQTLFAREHNRIVDLLPAALSAEQRFQIARRVVIAEQQYITYEQFLPALGITLPRYRGYRSDVDATLSNEFATVGYRAHSMIHGELELASDVGRYSTATLQQLQRGGVEVDIVGERDLAHVELAVPLNVAYFNPDLVQALQLGPLLQGVGSEAEYRNDEQIDNQLRSVLFQVPVAGNPQCLDGPTLPQCFRGVVDLGAVDVQRGRDHGMPSYNQLRRAYGLPARRTFRAVTGEASEGWPSDPELTAGKEVDDPSALDFVALFDADGLRVDPSSEAAEASVTRGERRTPLAARLKAVYGSVDRVDAFVGMVAEPHVRGTEFGELQLAIWTRQFEALRDGDRFFYRNDPGLDMIRRVYGVDFRRNLGDVIALNTDIPRSGLAPDVFRAPGT
jgi:Animal haem peroxidase